MARLALSFSVQSLADMQEVIQSREAFDFAAAHRLPRLIEAKAQLVLDNPKLHKVELKRNGFEYRRMIVQSCVVAYRFDASEMTIVRVFGPGRDWRGEI